MYSVQICNDWVEICIALEYAMIELKYVLRWNMQWLSWNMYSVSNMQWLSWNMYCVGICNDWAEICIAFEYAMIELKYVLRWKYAMNDWVEICIALE